MVFSKMAANLTRSRFMCIAALTIKKTPLSEIKWKESDYEQLLVVVGQENIEIKRIQER